jgi:choline dehydrogenase-like flavoprotein
MASLMQLETDVCIVGSGVAGGIVARACVDAGREVVMVEAGRRIRGRSLPVRALESIVRDYRIPRMSWHRNAKYKTTDYRSVGSREYRLRSQSLIARGGSTLGWGGDAYRLRPEDLRLRSMAGRGLDWPFSYDDLELHYTLAERSLRVAGDHLDGGHPPRSTPFPLPARPFGARDQAFLDVATDHGWAPMHHNTSLAPDGGAFTGDGLVDRLEGRPRFTLLTRCVAMRVVCSSSQRVAGVSCRDVRRSREVMIAADVVVVCAGAIESPDLLIASADHRWPDGVGNHSGHLGRHLISHTAVALGCRPSGFRFFNGAIGPTAATRHFDSETEQAAGKYILVWRPAPSGLLFLTASLEQPPTDNNGVSPGSGENRFSMRTPIIDFNHDEHHKARQRTVGEQLERMLEKVGLSATYRRRSVMAHPMCTARMSEDPRDGVVDPQLRVHGIVNLYICSSATFPTGGAANPTVTIAALAHRLGAHLASTRDSASRRPG